jgi:hypothetical protein
MVVSDELEVTAVRKDCGFVVDGAIVETEEQSGGDRSPPITWKRSPTASTRPSFEHSARNP